MRDRKVKIAVQILLWLLIIGSLGWFVYFNAREFLVGPSIFIDGPRDGDTLFSSPAIVRGSAKNTTSVLINGRQAAVTESGDFTEQVFLYPGLNYIAIEATDRFKNSDYTLLRVVYDPTGATRSY